MYHLLISIRITKNAIKIGFHPRKTRRIKKFKLSDDYGDNKTIMEIKDIGDVNIFIYIIQIL